MKRQDIKIWLCVCLGVLLCTYPLIGNYFYQRKQNRFISTYQTSLRKKDQLEKIWNEAVDYNQRMSMRGDQFATPTKCYEELLCTSKTGVMGVIEIPKIQVRLPIYHGTEEDVLMEGIGHMKETALPVGGTGTRCVLTGHRGVPGAKLFTRLDEMKKDDMFFLKVCNRTLAYKVVDLKVIRPEETKEIAAKSDKDYVTLVTCTPFGINSHRLLVTGERVSYIEEDYIATKKTIPSLREIAFTYFPCVFSGIVVLILWKRRRRLCEKNKKMV